MEASLVVYVICADCGDAVEEDRTTECACGNHICCKPLLEKKPCHCDCTPLTAEDRYYRLLDAITRRILLTARTQRTIL